jgi:hypothetical protein
MAQASVSEGLCKQKACGSALQFQSTGSRVAEEESMAPKQPAKMNRANAQRLANSIQERGDWHAAQMDQWIECWVRAVRVLDTRPTNAEWPWVSVFWIHLNGVLGPVQEQVDRKLHDPEARENVIYRWDDNRR